MLGMPWLMGNTRPVSGHDRWPSITSISSSKWCNFWSSSVSLAEVSRLISAGKSWAHPTVSAAVLMVGQSRRGRILLMNSGENSDVSIFFSTICKTCKQKLLIGKNLYLLNELHSVSADIRLWHLGCTLKSESCMLEVSFWFDLIKIRILPLKCVF